MRLPILAASAAVLCVFFACDDNTASAPVDYTPLLHSLTENVALPAHATFATKGDELASATTALAAAPDPTSLMAAQNAWRAARAAYRTLDALHFGPIAELAIAERIDVAPTDTAAIDALVAGTTPIDVTSVGAAGGKTKGFLALDYLLFGADAPTRLAGDARRRMLAAAIAAEIATSAHQVADAWTSTYAHEIETAGAGSTQYPSQRAAVDDFVGGVAYAFEVIVGVRLAIPLGRHATGTPDPSLDVTPRSDNARADMTATLAGIAMLYDGDALGARVRTKSAPIDAKTTSELTDCSSKLTAIPPPFSAALTGSTAIVQGAYDACKAAKLTWNTDVTSALGATLKPGDNDGD